MVKKKIVFKVISKRKVNLLKARIAMKQLRKKGFKNITVEDFKTIGKGTKIKGVGTTVSAFKGRKKTPKGFRSKTEIF